jgi:hypothetical protein
MRVSTAESDSVDMSQDPRWQLVQRISRSPQFQKAARLRDFLNFVAAQTLQGRTADVNEHQIGCSVFERPSGYSPSEDNIVRVHARQLRLRLEEYFVMDGRGESMVIEIPKGSYVPIFHERVTADGAQAPVAAPSVSETRLGLLARIPQRFALASSAVLLVVCLMLMLQNWKLRQTVAEPPADSRPWMLASVLDKVEPTTVVVADSGFGALRYYLNGRPPLADYVEPGYPKGLINPGMTANDEHWVHTLTNRPYTTYTSAIMVAQMARLAERNGWRLVFRFARDLNSRDFHEGRFILIGSAIVNPWVSLFEDQLNFPSDWDPVANRSLFRNVAPRPGEQAIYMPEAPNAVPGESFGGVYLLMKREPAARTGTTVLMIEGTNIESSEAAANFVFDAKMSADALRAAGARPPAAGTSRYRFEAVLRTRAVSGASRDTKVAATRYAAEGN